MKKFKSLNNYQKGILIVLLIVAYVLLYFVLNFIDSDNSILL